MRIAPAHPATFYELPPLGEGRSAVRGQPRTVKFYKSDDHGGMYMDERKDGATRAISYERPAPLAGRTSFAEYAGTFRSPELSARRTIRDTPDGRLIVTMPRDSAVLRRAALDVFSDGYLLVVFKRSPEGRITGFAASAPRTLAIQFTREGR